MIGICLVGQLRIIMVVVDKVAPAVEQRMATKTVLAWSVGHELVSVCV